MKNLSLAILFISFTNLLLQFVDALLFARCPINTICLNVFLQFNYFNTFNHKFRYIHQFIIFFHFVQINAKDQIATIWFLHIANNDIFADYFTIQIFIEQSLNTGFLFIIFRTGNKTKNALIYENDSIFLAIINVNTILTHQNVYIALWIWQEWTWKRKS